MIHLSERSGITFYKTTLHCTPLDKFHNVVRMRSYAFHLIYKNNKVFQKLQKILRYIRGFKNI